MLFEVDTPIVLWRVKLEVLDVGANLNLSA
jgi:hypothetical protein